VALATISFFALAVFGLGALSVATDADIIAVRDLGQAPGVIGMLAAVVSFALMLWSTLRRGDPSYVATIAIALVTGLVHLATVWIAVLVGTGSIVLATAVAGDLVRGGASAILLLAALIAAWGGIALRRTRAEHPRWPWERDEDE
jgi:small-conductance mechanosensitive channel